MADDKDHADSYPFDGDDVNDMIVDRIADAFEALHDAYEILGGAGGWYNLIKANDPVAALLLIKFYFLYRELWIDKGRGPAAGVFGIVTTAGKSSDPINLDNIPF